MCFLIQIRPVIRLVLFLDYYTLGNKDELQISKSVETTILEIIQVYIVIRVPLKSNKCFGPFTKLMEWWSNPKSPYILFMRGCYEQLF